MTGGKIRAFFQESIVCAVPIFECTDPPPLLSLRTYHGKFLHKNEEISSCLGLGMLREPCTRLSDDMNQAALNLCRWPHRMDGLQEASLTVADDQGGLYTFRAKIAQEDVPALVRFPFDRKPRDGYCSIGITGNEQHAPSVHDGRPIEHEHADVRDRHRLRWVGPQWTEPCVQALRAHSDFLRHMTQRGFRREPHHQQGQPPSQAVVLAFAGGMSPAIGAVPSFGSGWVRTPSLHLFRTRWTVFPCST